MIGAAVAKGFTVRFYQGRMAAVTAGFAREGVLRAAEVTRGRVRANISRLPRVDSGRMRDTIQMQDISRSPQRPTYRIYSPLPYTRFQEFGTRDHGPVRAPFMVFRLKGTNTIVRAKWVRGVTPGRFFRDALQSLTVQDFL